MKKKYNLDNPDKKRLYRIWWNMKYRCYGRNKHYNKNYTSRGITVCEEWRNNFDAFYEWSLNNGYKKPLSIDRIDNNKGYSPDNCRWATQKEQMNNVRYNIIMTMNGISHTIAEWSQITGINHYTLYSRKDYGWDDEKSLTTVSARNGIIVQMDLNDNIIKMYDTLKEAFMSTGISISNISLVCNGKRNNAGGYKWKRI